VGKRRGIAFIFILIIAALAIGGAVAYVGTNPDLVNTITQKIKDIITPGPPIGDLTPVRDLKGTWVSSIKGKGFQLYGKFPTAGGTAVVYQNSDITLKIDSVSGNTARGTITYTNICTWGSVTVTGYGSISTPKTCANAGAQAISIRVSGSRLDFGTISAAGATITMQGNFTTDLISGTMTMTSAYGIIKGEFHLIRKK